MKKLIAVFFVLFMLTRASGADDTVVIKEKMFVAQTNDVYINTDEYLGKKIKLEGMIGINDEFEPPIYYVYRYGPGCCGFDLNAGFEVIWKDPAVSYPRENEWVEATGILEVYEDEGEPFLRLDLVSMAVKSERGLERVEQ